MLAPFGTFADGTVVDGVTLSSGGTQVRVLAWGAILQDVRIAGVDHSLVLGSADIAAYQGALRYCGAIVGPVANRIRGGTAELDGRSYHFDRNENDRTTLHGGELGTDAQMWTVADHGPDFCQFTLNLADGQGGFPGNRNLRARYELDRHGVLTLRLSTTTDAPTWINLASHAYWNLTGRDGLDDHLLQIAADTYLPTDTDSLPAKGPVPVTGTRFDFRTPRPVVLEGDALLDHNFCLTGTNAVDLTGGGLRLRVTTNAPGVQIYEGAHLDAGPGHDGRHYGARAGLAIEPQHWPDAPNRPDFPSVRLDPGQRYDQTTRFHVMRLADPLNDAEMQ